MAAEKVGKAYAWGSGKPPPLEHRVFAAFMRALLVRKKSELRQVAHLFGYGRVADFERGVAGMLPLAYALQNLSPGKFNQGVNPEYPWPHDAPAHAPASHSFRLWGQLVNTG